MDRNALHEWFPVENSAAVRTGRVSATRLLGTDLTLTRAESGAPVVTADSRALPTRERYGFLWTTLGEPPHEVVEIAEATEADRRYVACGWVTLRASAPRLVENFLDMAHFPFVHADVLGVEDAAEVLEYDAEIRADVDEVWATNCRFFQPRVTASATGELAQLSYRVPNPFLVMLYRVPPEAPERQDVIALLIQPMDEELCRAQPLEFLVDTGSSDAALVDFEQMIFLQDRIIVENQRPRRLPLDPRAEIPTRADASSITYRRWLKQKNVQYGVLWNGGTPRSLAPSRSPSPAEATEAPRTAASPSSEAAAAPRTAASPSPEAADVPHSAASPTPEAAEAPRTAASPLPEAGGAPRSSASPSPETAEVPRSTASPSPEAAEAPRTGAGTQRPPESLRSAERQVRAGGSA